MVLPAIRHRGGIGLYAAAMLKNKNCTGIREQVFTLVPALPWSA
jgi:hypothetical protein